MFAKGMSCDLKVDIFIPQPTLSWNEVYHLLQKDIVWTFFWHLMGIFYGKTMLLETIYIYIKCY
jgi:hypothetical protein